MNYDDVVLATDTEGLTKQAEHFLNDSGLGNTDVNRRLFAMMVQNLPPDQDSFLPSAMRSQIRKALINEAAYYMLKPAVKEENEASKEVTTAMGKKA